MNRNLPVDWRSKEFCKFSSEPRPPSRRSSDTSSVWRPPCHGSNGLFMFLSTNCRSRQFVGVFIFCKHDCGWRRVEEGGHTSKAHDKWVNNIVPLIHHDHSVLLQHIRKLELLIWSIVIIEDVPPAAIAPATVVVAPQQPGGNIAAYAPTAVLLLCHSNLVSFLTMLVQVMLLLLGPPSRGIIRFLMHLLSRIPLPLVFPMFLFLMFHLNIQFKAIGWRLIVVSCRHTCLSFKTLVP